MSVNCTWTEFAALHQMVEKGKRKKIYEDIQLCFLYIQHLLTAGLLKYYILVL